MIIKPRSLSLKPTYTAPIQPCPPTLHSVISMELANFSAKSKLFSEVLWALAIICVKCAGYCLNWRWLLTTWKWVFCFRQVKSVGRVEGLAEVRVASCSKAQGLVELACLDVNPHSATCHITCPPSPSVHLYIRDKNSICFLGLSIWGNVWEVLRNLRVWALSVLDKYRFL